MFNVLLGGLLAYMFRDTIEASPVGEFIDGITGYTPAANEPTSEENA